MQMQVGISELIRKLFSVVPFMWIGYRKKVANSLYQPTDSTWYIYVICWLGGPYSEKTVTKVLNFQLRGHRFSLHWPILSR